MPRFLLILTRKICDDRWQVRFDQQSHFLSIPDAETIQADRSYVIRLDDTEDIIAALREQFWEFNWLRHSCPSLWKLWVAEHHESVKRPTGYVPEDENGESIARKMVDFIIQHRIKFGDEGHWHIWTCRELLLKRDGVDLAGFLEREQQLSMPASPPRHCPKSDYADELDSFRFPSISCLYGGSQLLKQLGGVKKFEKLFIQDGTGVYLVFHEDQMLYVGMSLCFSQRLSNASAHHKLSLIVKQHPKACVALIHYPYWKLTALDDAVTQEESEAGIARVRELVFGLERACIEHYQPIYNRMSLEQAKELHSRVH